MPDDNRFAGLSEVVEGDEETDDPENATEGADGTAAATGRSDAEPPGSDAETSPADDRSSDEPDEEDDPVPFSFDETTKKTVYVRPETLERLEDARALVDAQLRTQHDVRDLTGREFYDAVFRLAEDDTDALIEEILGEREE